MHEYRDLAKVVKVVESCKTMAQLEVAQAMIQAYVNYYESHNSDLYVAVCRQYRKMGDRYEP